MYGFGLSEEFLGDFMRRSNTQPVIATKFAPLPWRFTSGSVVGACRWVVLCAHCEPAIQVPMVGSVQ